MEHMYVQADMFILCYVFVANPYRGVLRGTSAARYAGQKNSSLARMGGPHTALDHGVFGQLQQSVLLYRKIRYRCMAIYGACKCPPSTMPWKSNNKPSKIAIHHQGRKNLDSIKKNPLLGALLGAFSEMLGGAEREGRRGRAPRGAQRGWGAES